MRIAYKNIIDDLQASSLTAYSELVTNPLTNVQDDRLTVTWQTDTSATTQSAVIRLNTVPEYPDNSTGTTYIQSTWATVDGWSSPNMTEVVSAGYLVGTSDAGGDCYFTKSGLSWASSSSVRIKIKRSTAGDFRITGTVGGSVGSTILSAQTLLASNEAIYSAVLLGSTTTVNIYFDSLATGASAYVKFIYNGTGEYTSRLRDLTGNGYNCLISGGIPENGVIYRDGINDYERTINEVNISDLFGYFEKWIIPSNITANQCLFSMGQSGIPRITFYRWANTRNLRVYYYTTTDVYKEIIDFFPSSDTEAVYAGIYIDFKNEKLYIYKNGEKVIDYDVTDIQMPLKQYWYFGAITSSISIPCKGYVSFRRIFNVIHSPEEVKRLYDNPDLEMSGTLADLRLDHDLQVNTAAILGHNITSSAIMRIEANNYNEWTSPPLSECLCYSGNEKPILNFLSSNYIYKYWRFYFYGQASISIGRLWLGSYTAISPSSSLDFEVIKNRNDIITHGRGRQKYVSVSGDSWRTIRLRFPETLYYMVYQIEDLYETVGNYKSFIFCNFDTIRNYEIVEPLYCSINGSPTFRHSRRMRFQYELELEEEK